MCVLLQSCGTDDDPEVMLARLFVASSGKTLPYRIFFPDTVRSGAQLPLVIFLHGGTGAGVDNKRQVIGENRHGAQLWIRTDMQIRHPCVVLAPQLPEHWRWDAAGFPGLSGYGEALVELLLELLDESPVDKGRVYLTGQSLGGWGTWDLITKRPELFAAAVPVCGGGDPNAVRGLEHISVWAFHGRHDSQVPVEQSRAMVAAIETAGATVRYTEYKALGHSVWRRAYAEKELVEWLFAQRKPN
jgi:predicted peptidase